MTINVVNRFKLPAMKRSKDARAALAGERFPVSARGNVCSSKKIFQLGNIVDDIKSRLSLVVKVPLSPSLLEVCAELQEKEQKKVLSKVKSARESVHKLFKTTGHVSPAMSFTRPLDEERRAIPIVPVEEHGVASFHSSCFLASFIPPRSNRRVRVVRADKTIAPLLSRCEAVDSLIDYSKRLVGEHLGVFFPIMRSEVGPPIPSSVGQPYSIFPSHVDSSRSEFHTIVQDVDDAKAGAEGVYVEPKELVKSSSCALSPAGMSEEEYDAVLGAELEAEFAAFALESGDIEEWTDELERKKQANMDEHFAYCSVVLAIPVPKLSAFFSSDSLADLARLNENDLSSDPSPTRTETSGTRAPSVDTSLTSVDAEDSHRILPETFRALRRVRNYGDLRSMLTISAHGDSCSDLTCPSDTFGLSDMTPAGVNAATLRRSAKFNDLKDCFLSLESRSSVTPSSESSKRKSLRTWFKGVKEDAPPQGASRSKGPLQITSKSPVSRGRQFLINIFQSSHRVREHIADIHTPHPLSSSPPIWSCAKIARSDSKLKKRRRMSKKSLKALKERLNSIDIDPWY